jgi:hypothetical protein
MLKVLFCLLLILLNALQTKSQTNTDSLLAILNSTSVDRSGLQSTLNLLEKMPPDESG